MVLSRPLEQVALDAIQCLGGNGYINDYPTGRILRDAKLSVVLPLGKRVLPLGKRVMLMIILGPS